MSQEGPFKIVILGEVGSFRFTVYACSASSRVDWRDVLARRRCCGSSSRKLSANKRCNSKLLGSGFMLSGARLPLSLRPTLTRSSSFEAHRCIRAKQNPNPSNLLRATNSNRFNFPFGTPLDRSSKSLRLTGSRCPSLGLHLQGAVPLAGTYLLSQC